MREVIFSRSLPLATRDLRIVPCRLGDRAGVIGAAIMVIEHVLAPEAVDRAIQACRLGLEELGDELAAERLDRLPQTRGLRATRDGSASYPEQRAEDVPGDRAGAVAVARVVDGERTPCEKSPATSAQ